MSATIPLEEARRLVVSLVSWRTPIEPVPLDACAGRRLGAEVHADGPWPATDRSAMDGFAVHAGAGGLAAGTRLAVIGESLAGSPFDGRVGPGEAIRIMTGGVVPPGADAVVMVEQTSGFAAGGAAATVVLHAAIAAGANVRRQGSEIAAGALLLRPGALLGPPEVGVLAVLGRASVPCHARPRVAVLATGDEVVPIERAPLPHQVRDSNAHAIAAQVRAAGGEPLALGIAGDRREALRHAVRRGLEADVLLTIGGVSKGTHDLVHDVLRELGVGEVFHGIALKPGKPTFFGTAPRDGAQGGARRTLVFGLPGNPASCTTVFDLLVVPALALLAGGEPAATVRAWPAGARFRRNPRLQAIPARLAAGEAGELLAVLSPPSPSGDPFGLLGADGYALIPADVDPDAVGPVEFVPRAGGWPRA